MAYATIKNVRISSISCAAPSHIKRSSEYDGVIGGQAVEKFINVVGIRQRHLGGGQITTSDLCYSAAKYMFEEREIDPLDIEALIFVSQTPDYIAPATACVLQHRLGLREECLAFDINLCCSGYVYGLYTAALNLQEGELKKVLLLAGDTASYTCSPSDSGQMMLFGDAGTATLLEFDETAPEMKFHLKTKGDGYRSLIIPGGGYRHWGITHERYLHEDGVLRSDYDCHMEGTEVFKFSITEVPELIKGFFDKYSLNKDQFDSFVFHQANMFIIKNIAKRLKMEEEKVLFSMDAYGNTGSATIPLTLCHNNEKNRKALKVMLCGFGIGLSLGAAAVTLEQGVCLPVIFSDFHYNDGIEYLFKKKEAVKDV